MNTEAGTTTGTIPVPLDAVLAMLNSLSRFDRHRLTELMTEQLEREEAETWEKEDNVNLDAFLEKISGDWGGDANPEEIARELRQGPEMSRNVEVW